MQSSSGEVDSKLQSQPLIGFARRACPAMIRDQCRLAINRRQSIEKLWFQCRSHDSDSRGRHKGFSLE
jgi:hypothetical protein